MTEQEIVQLVRKIIREELETIFKTDRFTFEKNIQILDARNIQVGKGTGTKIGTEVTQKIAFYGETPVIQASAITPPAGGATQDAEARAAIGFIITAIKNFGIVA